MTLPLTSLIKKNTHLEFHIDPYFLLAFSASKFNNVPLNKSSIYQDKKSEYPAAGIKLSVLKRLYEKSSKAYSDRIETFFSLNMMNTYTFRSSDSSILFNDKQGRNWLFMGAGYGINILRYGAHDDMLEKPVFKIPIEIGVHSAIMNSVKNPTESNAISQFSGFQPYVDFGIQARLLKPVWLKISYRGSFLYRYFHTVSGDIPRFSSINMGLNVCFFRTKRYQY